MPGSIPLKEPQNDLTAKVITLFTSDPAAFINAVPIIKSHSFCHLPRSLTMAHPQMYRFLLRLRPFLFLFLASQLVTAASSPQYLFNRADFPTGNFPSSVAVGDFNNDGRPDVAIS